MKPTIHLTNWSSRRLHGPGHVFSIMARPRGWEHGDGTVLVLVPPVAWLLALQAGTMEPADYMDRLRQRWAGELDLLAPGRLMAKVGTRVYPVEDGATLCCACGVQKVCHRRTAAPLLQQAGWHVVLDGEVLS